MCNNQKVQCEKATLHSDSTLHCKGKQNEDLKQVAYVNHTLNDIKKLAQVLGDFIFVDKCKDQYCFVIFVCLIIEKFGRLRKKNPL